MNKIDEIKEFIRGFLEDEENGYIDYTQNEDKLKELGCHDIEKYGCTYIFDNYEQGMSDIIKLTNKIYKTNIKLDEVGGYDSCGLNVKCYAWAGIVDGELLFDSWEFVSY